MKIKILIGLILIISAIGCMNENTTQPHPLTSINPLKGTAANVTISYFLGEEQITPNPVFIRYTKDNGRIPFDYDKIVRFNASVGDEIIVAEFDENVICLPSPKSFRVEKQIEHWTRECINFAKKEDIRFFILDKYNLPMILDEENGSFIIPISTLQNGYKFTLVLMNYGSFFEVGGIVFSYDSRIEKIDFFSGRWAPGLWRNIDKYPYRGIKNYELLGDNVFLLNGERQEFEITTTFERHKYPYSSYEDIKLNINVYDAHLIYDKSKGFITSGGDEKDIGIEDIELKILFRYEDE